MTTVNLNTMLIITFLSIIIIILSSVKICNIPSPSPVKNKNNIDDRFVDQRYSYISEPFETLSTSTTNSITTKFGNLADDNFNKKLAQTIDQEKQNKNIKELEELIDTLENKINVLSKIW